MTEPAEAAGPKVGAGGGRAAEKELTVLTHVYDLLLWLIPATGRFPKNQRYLLGERIENQLLDVLDLLISARYSKEKADILRSCNLKLEQFRYLLRLCKDLRLFDLRRYEYAAGKVEEIGRQVGGWQKHETGKPACRGGAGR